MKNKKKEIMLELNNFVDKYQFEGNIIDVVNYVKCLPQIAKDRYPENKNLDNAHKFAIRHDTDYDGYESHDVFHLQYFRWETETELKARLSQSKKMSVAAKNREKNKKLAKEKRELTLYKNLKNKFEKL